MLSEKKTYTTLQKFGLCKICFCKVFYAHHLFDKKYSKNICFQFEYILKCNLFLWGKVEFPAATEAFNPKKEKILLDYGNMLKY